MQEVDLTGVAHTLDLHFLFWLKQPGSHHNGFLLEERDSSESVETFRSN